MITKQLGKITFAWEPSAFKGRGYWFVFGKNGGLGRAASKKEANVLKVPKEKKPQEQERQEQSEPTQSDFKPTVSPVDNKKQNKSTKQPLISTKTFNSLQDIKSGDTLSNALSKLYTLVKVQLEAEHEQEEIDALFDEEREELKEKWHKELLEAILPKKKPAEVKSRQQRRAEERKQKKEEKKVEKPAEKKVEKPAEKKVEKPAEKKVEKPAEKPKAEKVEKEVSPKKVTTEPVKQVQPPKATTEPVPPIKTPPSAAISTASKIGKVAVGVGLAGLLMKAESSDYNQLVIPTKEYRKEMPQKANLTGMTIKDVLDYQNEMIKSGKYPSSAVGKYQIIRKTLESAVDYFKKKPDSGITLNTNFDETTQDKIYREYLISGKRKAVEDYVTGKKTGPDALIAAQLDMAKEFASFSVPEDINRPADPKGNWDARLVKKGESYYIGDKGGNKASVTPEMSAKALNEERLLRSPDKTTPVLPTPSSASVAQSSIQNKDLKSQSGGGTTIVNNNTNVVAQGGKQETVIPKKVNDKPAMFQG